VKKVLIITYYWPPAGGPGVQRWLKFVKYLPESGVEPIVYTPENPNYPIIDKDLLSEMPEGLTVLKTPIKEPYKMAGWFSKKKAKTISKGIIHQHKNQGFIEKLMLYIRGNFFIPDARKAWVKPSVSYLSKYIQDNDIQTIITTGPPHSLHLIGLQLKEKHGLKWIADFRDPWTTIGYHKKLRLSQASTRKHEQLEKAVLTKTDQIIVTSLNTKKEFELKTEKPIAVITNGFDHEVLTDVALDEKFTLAHIGSLLSGRNPLALWEVLSELVTENPSFAEVFELNLVGTVSEDVVESIHQNNLKEFTNVIGYVTHQEAISYQNKSQVLLLIEIDSEDTKCIIPGKLFEYLASQRPIIALGPKGSDVEGIINETSSGRYFSYDEKADLKTEMARLFKRHQEGNLKSETGRIDKYTRRELTKSLAELI
jgi:hypothetical protein